MQRIVVSLSRHQAALIIQRQWRAYISRKLEKWNHKRMQLAMEFADLERQYVQNIAYVCAVYEEPLRSKVRIPESDFEVAGV